MATELFRRFIKHPGPPKAEWYFGRRQRLALVVPYRRPSNAEGVGALYLKRLSDAVRDGNPIRGVVRATAVNTNGKVPGMGITHPSIEGQERVVRMAYEKSHLDPSLTAYAELHGTGTPVGDPIEVRAISRALNDKRSSAKPLLVGAVSGLLFATLLSTRLRDLG